MCKTDKQNILSQCCVNFPLNPWCQYMNYTLIHKECQENFTEFTKI